MDILIISGFLGSGKTTLLLAIVPRLREIYPRIAVVENEIGQVGIDGKLIEKHGLTTRELFSGCICCTMGADLIRNLRSLHDQYDPDLVIIEPTGVANPDAIIATTERYPWPEDIGRVKVISLFDPTRLDDLIVSFKVPISRQMKCADLMVITKADLCDPRTIELSRKWLVSQSPDCPIILSSRGDGLSLDMITDLVVS